MSDLNLPTHEVNAAPAKRRLPTWAIVLLVLGTLFAAGLALLVGLVAVFGFAVYKSAEAELDDSAKSSLVGMKADAMNMATVQEALVTNNGKPRPMIVLPGESTANFVASPHHTVTVTTTKWGAYCVTVMDAEKSFQVVEFDSAGGGFLDEAGTSRVACR